MESLPRIPHSAMRASFAARTVGELLGKAHAGDIVTYALMLELTGVDFQKRSGLRKTACLWARRLYAREFEALDNVGLLCLEEDAKIEKVATRQASTHRRERENQEILAYTDYPNLSSSLVQHAWLVRASIATELVRLTHAKTVEALTKSPEPLPLPPIDVDQYRAVFKQW